MLAQRGFGGHGAVDVRGGQMEYESIAAELLRALRGPRSQTAFARRVGLKPNTIYGWEAGRRWPTAARAFAAGARVGVDPKEVLRRFFRVHPPWIDEVDLTTGDGVARLLRDLRGTTAIGEVAARSGRSRFAVARWLSGEAEPRVPDFLRLVEATSLRLLDLVAAWVDPEAVPSVAPAWRQLEAHRRMLVDAPWTTAVLRALDLEAYRSATDPDAAWLAARLSLPEADVARWLDDLARVGRIRREGARWVPNEVPATVTPTAGKVLKAHWARVGVERLEAGADGLSSYHVFTVSEADYARLRELHLAYFRELRAIAAASAPGDRVVLANVQLLPLTT
jgi:transcriptional regulator with XRE-family HTH domain